VSDVDRVTRALGRLGAFGKPGALIGLEADLVRALGPRLSWDRLRRRDAPRLPGNLRAEIYRRIWEEAAAAVGAEVRTLEGGFQEIRRGGRSTRVYGSLVPLDDPVTLELAGDKPLVHKVLTGAGLPVPAHVVLPTADVQAGAEFVREQPPCVVKPAFGSGRGAGITGFVTTPEEFLRARLRAIRYDAERLLVERQAAGAEYRVLVLGGSVIGVVRRDPPHVTGDGASTILQLVEAENVRRVAAAGAAGPWLVEIDLDAVFALRQEGMDLASVPAAGRRVRVHAGSSQGSEVEAHVVPKDDPSVRGIAEAGRRAAEAIGSEFASVEIITPDATRDLGDAGGVILEINTTPGIAQHYIVSDRTVIEPVAAVVLERLLA
jgi:cyanophycin synthetase